MRFLNMFRVGALTFVSDGPFQLLITRRLKLCCLNAVRLIFLQFQTTLLLTAMGIVLWSLPGHSGSYMFPLALRYTRLTSFNCSG